MTGIARTFLRAGAALLAAAPAVLTVLAASAAPAASAQTAAPAGALVQAGPAPRYALSTHDPLGPLVAEALAANPALAAERLAERAADAAVREARGLLLPGAAVESRYTGQRGTLNLGGLMNPAYATLNELTGAQHFPTNLDLPLPLRHETRLRLVQPVFSPAARARS